MSTPFPNAARRRRAEALIGRVVNDRYRIDAILGIGSMGSVFRARHLGLKRDVALKVLHRELTSDREMATRFAREAAGASRLEHPNCVTVTDFGATSDGDHYMVMQLLEGRELYELLDRALPFARMLDLGRQVLKGLAHAHDRGLVHRDVKPENIFVTTDHDGLDQIKVLDFGIAKIVSGEGSKDDMTRAGMVFGTPAYMSPEQATGGRVDLRTDLYAVGVLFFVMLTGALPFDDDDPVQLVRKHIKAPPPALPEHVPPMVRRVVERLLAKDPLDRFASAHEVLAALPEPAPRGVDMASNQTQVAPGPTRGQAHRPRWGLIALGGVGTVAICGALIVVWLGSADPMAAGTDASADASTASVSASSIGPAPTDADVIVVDPDGDSDGAGSQAERALEANLESIDALIAGKNYAAARISIEPLLKVYPRQAGLHWRLGKAVWAAGGKGSAAEALPHYAATLASDPGSLKIPEFAREFNALLRRPKVRREAISLAIDHLGRDGHAVLLEWLNVDASPLDYAERQRIIAHLEQDPDARSLINRPLQRALDLWQADQTQEPCVTFARVLVASEVNPDSYLVGTLQTVSVPGDAPTDASPSTPACETAQGALERVRDQHVSLFAGIDPIVPDAYRKAKSGRSATAAGSRRGPSTKNRMPGGGRR